MKRDMDLVREILLQVEAHPRDGDMIGLNIPEHSQEVISYHVRLLSEAGYIRSYDVSDLGGLCWKPTALTWDGHEFVEASRDEGRWKQAKEMVQTKGGGFVLSVLKEVLIELMKRSVLSV